MAMATVSIWALTTAVTLPIVTLAIECLVGSLTRRDPAPAVEPPPFTVLMPAHDEALGITGPIRAVLAQLRSCDALVVVADNCTDDTARIARALGADVVVRHDPKRRGKGYALETGRQAIAVDPERIMILVDADCIAAPGALPRLAATAQHRQAVVQGAYLLDPPAGAGAMVRLSAFAFLVKNLVRQRGLQRLGGAALLQGSGMAFPQAVFRQLDWRAASLVEDLDLGMRLLADGHRVTFDDGASFVSPAAARDATIGQRRRWEHGVMQSIGRNVAMMLRAGLGGNPRLLIVALDQMVPPAAPLIIGALALAALLLGLGWWSQAVVVLAALALLMVSLAVAWARFGRRIVPAAMLGRTLGYLVWKLPLTLQFVTRRERHWLRTEREP